MPIYLDNATAEKLVDRTYAAFTLRCINTETVDYECFLHAADNTTHGIIFLTLHRNRNGVITKAFVELAYEDSWGDTIHLERDHKITVEHALELLKIDHVCGSGYPIPPREISESRHQRVLAKAPWSIDSVKARDHWVISDANGYVVCLVPDGEPHNARDQRRIATLLCKMSQEAT